VPSGQDERTLGEKLKQISLKRWIARNESTEQSQDFHAEDCSVLCPSVGKGFPLGEARLAATKGPERFIPVSDYLFGVIAKSATGRSLHPF
jgi:hypothetical protein